MPKKGTLEDMASLSEIIIQNMFAGVCMIRASDGVIVYSNSKFDSLFGYEKSELIGKAVSILNYEDRKNNTDKTAQSIIEQINATGEASYEVYNVKKDGTPFWCQANTTVFDHPEFGTVFVAVQRDIDSEKQVTERLQKSESQLKLVVETTFDGFWDWHIPTNYEYMSPRFWQILGIDPKEKKHHASEWQEYIFQEDLEVAIKNLDLHIKSKGKHPYYQEVRYRHQDGHTVWVICKGSVVEWDDKGNAIRMIGTHTDITELKVAQSALINSSKMYSLGVMAGGIAHEINTPLAIIAINLSNVKEALTRENYDKRQAVEALESIEKTTFRIANIVKGLRTFSMDGSKDPFTTVKLKSVIEDTLSLCQERFKEHEMALRVPIIREDITLDCRPTEIGQVLLNLLNNAYDAVHSAQEKWIEIEIRDGDSIEISVSDSGAGIQPELRNKIMEPFFTTKEIGKGTGLGLSISKGIIESHNGTLVLDPKSKHTKFVIRIPKSQRQVKAVVP